MKKELTHKKKKKRKRNKEKKKKKKVLSSSGVKFTGEIKHSQIIFAEVKAAHLAT